MIETIVKYGRAFGIIIAAIPAFVVAATVQVAQVLWRTAVVVWTGRLDTRSPQQIIAAQEQDKRRREYEAASKRRKERARAMRRDGSIVGAMVERLTTNADDGESTDEPDEEY